MIIGNFPDGLWGKEGVTGWSFGQMVTDTGVTDDGDNVWGGGGIYGQGLTYRAAFFRGFGDKGLMFEINPADIVSINIALPFFDGGKGLNGKSPFETGEIFQSAVAQFDFHLDFGNIAITYEGKPSYIQNGNRGWDETDGSVIYAYFGITAIDNLGIDVGLGYQLDNDDGTKNPISAGLGLKYSADSFGVKFRAAAAFGGEAYGGDAPMRILADVLPYFILSDSMRAFVSIGLGLAMPDEGDSVTAWHFNPWLEIGNEWGPAFYAGIKVQSNGGDDATVQWSVPIGLIVSF